MNDEMDGWVREYMNRGQGERQHEKEWKKERKGKADGVRKRLGRFNLFAGSTVAPLTPP